MITPPYDEWFPGAPIDGTYGYDLEALRTVAPVPPPPGFADTWRRWRREAAAVAAAPAVTPLGRRGAHEVSEVAFSTVDGLRLRGWLGMPATGPARVGVVHSHGYGGRDAPDFSRVPADAAVIFPVARGLGALNVGIGAPATSERHVLHGIGDAETYAIGRCAVDLWTAGDVLVELAGDVPLYVVGESFGGGVGALAFPWDDRVAGATLVVPSFGQYDIRLQVPCAGSGEPLRRYVAAHPEAREVLRLFDASTAATFARVPVRVEAALWDANVPAPGQFAVANAVAQAEAAGTGARLELEVLPAGHAEYPGMLRVVAAAAAATRAHIAASLAAAQTRA
ncbi:acetylxylan esterase [Microbacterium kyungheense]|uniref:Cephalosporin-C deacetylase n=1 Tax=Microbacterium kyungheense TaxID=1263636 RepID=A0A543EF90_9MICO|nr:acetylxylan esterase [Microbacterium kyungheense]TQM20240.1 cephalosporin-C deacetylase [Microbacterium kyungheense]